MFSLVLQPNVFCSGMCKYFREGFDPMLAGAYAASVLVRAVSKKTFDELGRSMVASDMLRSVPDVFKQMFEQ